MKNTTHPLQPERDFALHLLEWHGGQSSALYAIGSCMLSDAHHGKHYVPANHHGHDENLVRRAISELRNLKSDANYPESVTPAMESECNALADKLENYLQPLPQPVCECGQPAKWHNSKESEGRRIFACAPCFESGDIK